jgi:hypothetical protein
VVQEFQDTLDFFRTHGTAVTAIATASGDDSVGTAGQSSWPAAHA